MRSFLFTVLLSIYAIMSQAQEHNESLPYYEIPESPEQYSQGAIVSRMIDGLGFRYYWATDSLRPVDLQYKPSEEARTTEETMDHILALSTTIVNSALHKVNERHDFSDLTYAEKRKLTLTNLKKASDIFRNSESIESFSVSFKRKDGVSTYPFWNQISGPISDAIWHCGQVVSFRRASGNPLHPKVSFFNGKLRD